MIEPGGDSLSDGQRAVSRGHVRIGAVVAVAIAVGLAIWALVGGGGGDSSSTTEKIDTMPVAVSYDGLTTLAGALARPIYWVGAEPEMRYEVQQTEQGRIYVRYLPPGIEAGDPAPQLTVGTYPMTDAYAATAALADADGSVRLDAGTGVVAFSSTDSPTSAYVAFAGSDYQIEVYDPSPGVARRLVSGEGVTQVPDGRTDVARAVTPPELRRLAASLGRPIYWAGEKPGVIYELTRSSNRRVFVRYLPSGVAIGDSGRQRTIATYPLADAFDQTKAIAGEPGMELIKLPRGAVAVFGTGAKTTNGYVAFPDADYQIEVFDPTPGAARRLVESGRIAPVR